MLKVLLVDDEPSLVKGLLLTLEQAGYSAEALDNGNEVLPRLAKGDIDLLLLDVMLPGKDGITVCRDLRSTGWRLPVIMLSAKGEAVDRILGLEIGADDYLVKPFHSRELLARMKAVMRRQGVDSDQPLLTFPDFAIDLHRRVAWKGQVAVEFTAKEYDLLLFLANHPGRVFSREHLLQQVWGYDYLGDSRTIDVHIHHLRDKLEPDSGRPSYFLTARGQGYRFREDR